MCNLAVKNSVCRLIRGMTNGARLLAHPVHAFYSQTNKGSIAHLQCAVVIKYSKHSFLSLSGAEKGAEKERSRHIENMEAVFAAIMLILGQLNGVCAADNVDEGRSVKHKRAHVQGGAKETLPLSVVQACFQTFGYSQIN